MATTEAIKKLFTTEEYYKMRDVGILTEYDRVELIEGEIIEMSPMGVAHAAALSRAQAAFMESLGGRVIVRSQLPLHLDKLNEPQPDICLVKRRKDFYAIRHPAPADVVLILEIAGTFLRYDRDWKVNIYAPFRIPELWIADVKSRALLVCRAPSHGKYTNIVTFHPGQSVSPLMISDVTVAVNDIC